MTSIITIHKIILLPSLLDVAFKVVLITFRIIKTNSKRKVFFVKEMLKNSKNSIFSMSSNTMLAYLFLWVSIFSIFFEVKEVILPGYYDSEVTSSFDFFLQATFILLCCDCFWFGFLD